MKKVVISGYYGFNNIGDESILKAVIANLKEQIKDIDITVLSQNPEATKEKHGVNAVPRMKILPIFKAIKNSDLLISGGGSLLQDVTSKKSIIYYLIIIWIAMFLRKEVFIYSQGIGPVISKFNRRLMVRTLKRINYIVVRDEGSRELLEDLGIKPDKIYVTADPVIRIKPPKLEIGKNILENNGYKKKEGKMTVGFAIKAKKGDKDFVDQIGQSIDELVEKYDAQVVLIPFHYTEDSPVVDQIESKVSSKVICLNQKYLTEEMLSIIGNMDILVGVRLHSLIHAAIMDVPMIGISYDPKVNSFMRSIGLKAMCSIYDYTSEFFIDEYEKVIENKDIIRDRVHKKTDILIEKLNRNEELINELLEGKKR